MSLIYLLLTLGMLWINLVGIGLATFLVVREYAVARVAAVLALCLGLFFVEHFVGMGSHLLFLPFSTAVSAFMIWWKRDVLRENWSIEAWFALGFFYCLLWRYAFPDIDMTSERMPNLVFIEDYMMGQRLPPLDRWLPPFRANFYYSFQHYAAALMGRWLNMTPGMSYHLAYCTITGLITTSIGGIAIKFCSTKTARAVAAVALLVGGSGAATSAFLLMKETPNVMDCVRFLGGTMAHGIVDKRLNPQGVEVANFLKPKNAAPRDAPMEPLSYLVMVGDYHPPLASHLILAFSVLLMAALEGGAGQRQRSILHGLLGATVPLTLVTNAWIFPMQAILIVGYFLFRSFSGEKLVWRAGIAGAGVAAILEYPYLAEFTRQTTGVYAAIKWTEAVDRTPFFGWLLVFWPVAGLLFLTFWNKDRPAFSRYLFVVWLLLLAFTEFFFNDDLFGGESNRFNTCLKWWSWVYAGAVISIGISNLGATSRFCRYGSMALLIPTCLFAVPMARQFWLEQKPHLGKLEGSSWMEKDPVIKDLIVALAARPDGVAIQSGPVMTNSEVPAVSLFGRKQSLLGWPWHETTWRGDVAEIRERMKLIKLFYEGQMQDPLGWLLQNNVSYILWLPADNSFSNARFRPVFDKIKARYGWHSLYGNDGDFAVGFWERFEDPDPRGKTTTTGPNNAPKP